MLRRDWRRIAEGRTADIFELDERRVLKLFKQGYSMDAARRFCRAAKVGQPD